MKLQLWKSHLVSFLHSGLCKILDDIKLWILSNVIFSRCTCGIAIYIVYHLCLFQPQLHIMDVIEEEHIGVEKEEKFKILQNEWHKNNNIARLNIVDVNFRWKLCSRLKQRRMLRCVTFDHWSPTFVHCFLFQLHNIIFSWHLSFHYFFHIELGWKHGKVDNF